MMFSCALSHAEEYFEPEEAKGLSRLMGSEWVFSLVTGPVTSQLAVIRRLFVHCDALL